MASTKGIHLLKMPELGEENLFAMPTPQLYKPGHTAGRLKLLSLPQKSQEHAQKHVNLVQIPIKAMHPHASLLKLPRKLIEKVEENRKPFLIDSRNIKNGSSSPQNKMLPLLQKPRKTYEAEMIKLPLSKDLRNEQKDARLIALPVQIKTNIENHPKRRKENTILSELKDDTENKTRTLKDFEGANLSNWQDLGNKEKSQKEYVDDLKRTQRRKRQKKERNSGNSNQKCIETIKKSCPDKISIETQTTDTSSKKIRKSRHKVNLMSLLEQAAFLFDSDVSDEEIKLNTPEKRSHLIKEEAYSTIQDETDKIYAVSNEKESHAADRRVKKPLTTEQLLLDNLREERLINSANLLDNSDLAQFLEEPVSKMGDLQTKQPTKSFVSVATNHDSLGLTSSDLKRLRNASEIPNSSAGLSWNEVVSLSRNVSTNQDVDEMSKKENKGTQVMNANVETRRKEQVTQTDFTFATDVNKLILEHQEDQVKIQSSSVIQKSSERIASKVESEYPWEHIGRSNSPETADVTEHEISQKENDAFQTTKRRKTSAGNAVVINRVVAENLVADIEESKVPVLDQLSEVQPASGVHFAPEILLEMKVQDHHIEAKGNEFDIGTKLLNVVDISKPAADYNVADIEKDNIVVNDIAVEKLSEYVEIVDKPTIKENRQIKETFERSLSHSEYSFQEKQSPPVEEDVDQIADSQVERSQMAHKLDRILAEGPKDRLHNNLRNFSVQLDALDDLHDHLERELKHSALLMQTVGTLHSGFFENDVPARNKESKEPKYLYNNNKRRKSQSFEDSKTQNKPISEDMFLSDNVADDIHPTSYLNELAHHTDEETDKGPDEGKVEEFVEELQDTSHDMTNTATDSINGSHDKIGDSDSETNIADDIDANSPTPSQGEATEDVVQLADEDDEIRLRLTQRFPTLSQRQVEEDRQIKERAIREKLENKRKALRDWMKKKRSEQHTKYRAEVVEKRQKEARPFVGLQNAAKFTSQTSAKESKNKKKILSEELYQNRINDANELMSDIFATHSEAVKLEKSNRPFSVPTDAIKRKRNTANSGASRGKKWQRNSSSRTSTKRSGKTFLSFKDRAAIREKEAETHNELRKEAGKKWLIDNLSPSWKQSSFGNDSKQWQTTSNIGDRPNIENVNFLDLENSLEIPLLTSSRSKYSPKVNRFRLDLGELSYSETPDLRSGRSATRRSVEGRDFVTRTSMDQYRMKAAKSVRTSLKEYSANTQDISGENDGLSARFDYSFMTTLDMTGGYMKDKNALKNVSNQFGNSVDDEVLEHRKKKKTFENSSDAQDINAILTQYGLLDDEINQHNSSETSQLLAEANLILEESGEEEAALVSKNDSVDWDEVNMILKQN